VKSQEYMAEDDDEDSERGLSLEVDSPKAEKATPNSPPKEEEEENPAEDL
jgi:hypothetical protein